VVTLPVSASVLEGMNCSMAQYTACHLEYYGNEDNHCVDSCLLPCERWKYNSQLIEDTGYPWPSNYQVTPIINEQYSQWATIRLSVLDFDFPVFTEQYVWTFQNFAGSFGGALSILLGIDVTVVFQSLFYVCTVLYGFGAAIMRIRKKRADAAMPFVVHQRNIVVVPN
jgi:hypothetical protein